MSLLLRMFLTFMKIGVMSFGGGYAAMPLVEKEVVEANGWMTYEEFADIVTIDELTPGPVAINAATFVGTKMAGVAGAIVATIGNILPSIIIVLILAKIYYKYRNLKVIDGALSGLRSMVVALIGSTALTILLNALFGVRSFPITQVDIVAVGLFAIGLYVLRRYKINPILVMIGCGLIGLIIYPLFAG